MHYNAGTVMGVLGLCQSSFNNWTYRNILISDRKKDPDAQFGMYSLEEFLKGVIVKKLRNTRMDFSVAAEIAVAAATTERHAPLFWYNVETKEYAGCWTWEDVPKIGVLFTIDLDNVYEEVKDKIIAWEEKK